MFDLKDTAVFMYKAAKHRYIYIYIYFYMGWFWRSKCNTNCKRKFCSVRTLFTNGTLPYMSQGVTQQYSSFVFKLSFKRPLRIFVRKYCVIVAGKLVT